MEGTEAAAINRRARAGVFVLGVLSFAMLILAGAVIFAEIREPGIWDPLGEYPPQTVTSRVAGVPGPAATLDDTVDVEAVKCGPDSGGPVTVRTTLVWRSIDPRGAAWSRGESQTEREPGCAALSFHNAIPPQVVELVEAQHEAGFDRPVWEITGSETPIDDDGTEGAPRRWVTERFTLVH